MLRKISYLVVNNSTTILNAKQIYYSIAEAYFLNILITFAVKKSDNPLLMTNQVEPSQETKFIVY